MAKAIGIVYLLLIGALIASAAHLWQLRCEGFGCAGIGVAWVAWGAAVYLPTGVAGLLARSRTGLGAGLSRAIRFAVWVQAALGVGLLAYLATRAMG